MSIFATLRSWRLRPLGSAKGRYRSRPQMEALEARTLPDAGQIIAALYNHTVFRAPGPAEIQSGIDALNAGISTRQLALGYLNSSEHFTNLIRADYERLLGRDPEPSAVASWLTVLQAGASPDAVLTQIVASDEFFAKNGGTAAGWLNGVYNATLGRAVDAGGLASWSQALQAGASRYVVANSIATSLEADAFIVTSEYQANLLRAPEPSGLNAGIAALQNGMNSDQLAASIMGSAEFASMQSSIDMYAYATITGVSPDNGVSATDGITNSPNLTVNGRGTANTSFTVYVDFAADSQGVTDAQGNFSIALSKPLSEGRHTLGVSPVVRPGAPAMGQSYYVLIDLTPPTLTFSAPDFTTSTTPSVTVTAADNFGLDGVVHIDVDLNNDGNFTDPGELDYAVQPLPFGPTTFNLPALPEGTYQIRARVDDLAGNETSSTATMQIDPNAGFVGSQQLMDLYWNNFFANLNSGQMPNPGSPPPSTMPMPPFTDVPAMAPTVNKAEFLWDAQGRVLVRVRSTLTKYMGDLEAELKTLGMDVVLLEPSQNMIIGYLPLDKILDLPNQAHFSAATPVLKPATSVGSVDTEGDAVIQADTFRNATGIDGTGVKVGVLSDSVNEFANGLADSVKTGDLPSNVQILEDGPLSDPNFTPTDEGRAMLEIVHDIAPGASLAFHTAFRGEQDFANGIQALANNGAKVIADDVFYFDSPMFNDGVIAKAVNTVHSQGVFYTSAAGNAADHGWQDAWRPVDNQTIGTTGSGQGQVKGTFENFSNVKGTTQILQKFTLAAKNHEMHLSFQWDSAYLEGGSPLPNYQVKNDLAVYITSQDGSTIFKVFDDKNKNTDMAFEDVDFINDGSFQSSTTFAIAIQMHNPTTDPAPTHLRWRLVAGDDPKADFEGAPTTMGQAAANGAVAVGAVPWFSPNTPESFTSLGGPLTFLFDSNGKRLAKAEIRNKPELAAPDGVSTSFFGGPFTAPSGRMQAHAFFGTSAATPHVAGAAALLIEEAPAASPDQILQHLELTAIDVPPVGVDNLTGFGRIVLKPLIFVTGPDRFELNETSDAATNLGTLTTVPQVFEGLTIFDHPNGLSDYDWYRWTAGFTGTVTAKIQVGNNIGPGTGSLELHLFTVDSNNTLIDLGDSVTPGTKTQLVSAAVTAGQPILVEVKGLESSMGVWDQAQYTLIMSLA
jgi:hypothetical protein